SARLLTSDHHHAASVASPVTSPVATHHPPPLSSPNTSHMLRSARSRSDRALQDNTNIRIATNPAPRRTRRRQAGAWICPTLEYVLT
ncbi:hypothetical protein K523DRAFT_409869, partial [Schizophyllum commune Tattone D]